MKKPVTLRLDPQLLAAAKQAAEAENRTLTNFIETLVKERIGSDPPQPMTTSTQFRRFDSSLHR